uniref:Uncharacterized protein n=1 Tax=Anguilla anguilla TaxID=7936 RepID=A0A0E9SGR0_ANGAN
MAVTHNINCSFSFSSKKFSIEKHIFSGKQKIENYENNKLSPGTI